MIQPDIWVSPHLFFLFLIFQFQHFISCFWGEKWWHSKVTHTLKDNSNVLFLGSWVLFYSLVIICISNNIVFTKFSAEGITRNTNNQMIRQVVKFNQTTKHSLLWLKIRKILSGQHWHHKREDRSVEPNYKNCDWSAWATFVFSNKFLIVDCKDHMKMRKLRKSLVMFSPVQTVCSLRSQLSQSMKQPHSVSQSQWINVNTATVGNIG